MNRPGQTRPPGPPQTTTRFERIAAPRTRGARIAREPCR